MHSTYAGCKLTLLYICFSLNCCQKYVFCRAEVIDGSAHRICRGSKCTSVNHTHTGHWSLGFHCFFSFVQAGKDRDSARQVLGECYIFFANLVPRDAGPNEKVCKFANVHYWGFFDRENTLTKFKIAQKDIKEGFS